MTAVRPRARALPASTSRTVPAPRPDSPSTTAAAARPPHEGDAGGGEQRQRDTGDRDQSEGQVGTRVHREGVGRGEHVAAHRLQGGARHAEHGPDEQSGGHPRQPGGDDDGGVVRVGASGERLPDLGRADGGRALRDVDDREDREEEDQCGRHRGRARPGRDRRRTGGGGGSGDGHGCYFVSAATTESTYLFIDSGPPNIQMPSGSRWTLPFFTNGSDVHTLSLARTPANGVLALSPSLPM